MQIHSRSYSENKGQGCRNLASSWALYTSVKLRKTQSEIHVWAKRVKCRQTIESSGLLEQRKW